MDTQQVYDRLLPVVSAMDKTVTCQSVSVVSGGYKFLCKRTKWALVGFTITVGLVDYKITEVVFNESITVTGASLPTQLTFDLYPFIFKHGTIKKVAQELNEITDFKLRTPLLFLHEIVEEGTHLSSLDSIDIDADCRLYFLACANFDDWDQLQSDSQVVQPMRAAASEFIKSLSVSQNVSELTGIGTNRSHNLFGNYDSNGTVRNIFNEPLGGNELRISIPFLKNCDCCDIPQLDLRPAPGYVYDQLGSLLAILYSNEIYVTGTPCAGVTIKDQDGNILTTVVSGGNYNVTVLTEIRDTINANTATIIDNLT